MIEKCAERLKYTYQRIDPDDQEVTSFNEIVRFIYQLYSRSAFLLIKLNLKLIFKQNHNEKYINLIILKL